MGHAQEGYTRSIARDKGHDRVKFQAYYGWKECQRLGIPYEPEPLEHSNIHIRYARLDENERLSFHYRLDEGLTPCFEKARKYVYPAGMTPEEKRKFRAAQRRAKKG